ncbi:hypothetical protein NRIC_35090 [Enterococcus florum]|uniref:DUF3290 domain-containing protein n=1 Tax=Enterococcus florum TaxID=2480627 RepID=A0A4P5PH20_9ENTE|nr:DUF3290 domain-containing protein [Enterococcus florum]GCF95618.1 hypothetical protein NRIC_35090 [Enterococcus florum]
MNFYGINFIENQTNVNDYIKYGIIFLAIIFLIVVFSLYMRHRLQTKYRDLSILLLLVLLFMMGVQYSDYSQNKSRYTQSSQMVAFIKEVANEFNVAQRDVLVNSMQLTDGVVVKIDEAYYTVNLSMDQGSYRLSKTFLMNPQIIVNQ